MVYMLLLYMWSNKSKIHVTFGKRSTHHCSKQALWAKRSQDLTQICFQWDNLVLFQFMPCFRWCFWGMRVLGRANTLTSVPEACYLSNPLFRDMCQMQSKLCCSSIACLVKLKTAHLTTVGLFPVIWAEPRWHLNSWWSRFLCESSTERQRLRQRLKKQRLNPLAGGGLQRNAGFWRSQWDQDATSNREPHIATFYRIHFCNLHRKK